MSAPVPKKKIEMYLKVVRLAAEAEGGEQQAAKETLKKLLDKHPNIAFEAARHAAEEYARGRVAEAQKVAVAAGASLTPETPMKGLLNSLLERTASIIGDRAVSMAERVSDELLGDLVASDDYSPEAPMDAYLPANKYLRGKSIAAHLDELIDVLEADENRLDIEYDDDGNEYLRIEMTIPIDLVEAILSRPENKQEFVDWLTDGLYDDNSEEVA
jgi:hypothetical protein